MPWDAYTFQTRLRPGLLVVLPVGLLAAWFPDKFIGWGLFVSVATTCGLTTLVAQVARDQGKRKEPKLFELWGGSPTTRRLRHRDTGLDWISLTRCHAALEAALGLPAPTKHEEQADPATADSLYEAFARHLRNTTRDAKKHRLVFAENVNYSFRRNVWGMRPAGITLALLGAVAGIAAIVTNATVPIGALAAPIIATVLNLGLLVLWIFRFTPDWVRIAAEAYAERLLETAEAPAHTVGRTRRIRGQRPPRIVTTLTKPAGDRQLTRPRSSPSTPPVEGPTFMKKLIKDIARVRPGYQFRGRVEPDPAGNVAFIQIKDFDEQHRLRPDDIVTIDFRRPIEPFQARSGDVLFLSRGHRLFATPLDDLPEDAIVTGYFFIVRPDPDVVLPEYLAWSINQPNFQARLTPLVKGSHMPQVARADFEQLDIDVPPVETQHLVMRLNGLWEREQDLVARIQQAREQLLQAVTHGIASGRLAPPPTGTIPTRKVANP